jgi:hypothetical protein
MQLKIGYDIAYECPQITPMLLLLRVHPSRENDLLTPDSIITEPSVPIHPTLMVSAICAAALRRRPDPSG